MAVAVLGEKAAAGGTLAAGGGVPRGLAGDDVFGRDDVGISFRVVSGEQPAMAALPVRPTIFRKFRRLKPAMTMRGYPDW